MASLTDAMPDELSPRHLGRGLIQLSGVGAVVVLLIIVGPGLGSLRHRLNHASPGWLVRARTRSSPRAARADWPWGRGRSTAAA